MKKLVFSLLSAIFLFGCGTNTNNELRVGMEVGYAPFNWYQTTDANGAVKISSGYAGGYDVQMAKKIAKDLGKKLVIVPSDWDSLLGPAVNSGKVDLVIAGMSPTAERKKSLDFSNPYYESDILVVVRKDGPYANAKTLNDFKGAKITAQLNTLHYDLIDQLPGVKKQVAMENFPAMIVALNSGKIDGYIAEKPTAESAKMSNPNLTYVEFPEGQGFKYNKDELDVAIAMKKGRTELLNKVNEALSKISKEERNEMMRKAIQTQPVGDSSLPKDAKDLGFAGWTIKILKDYFPKYMHGTFVTIYLSVIGTIVGSFIGIFVAVINTMDLSDKRRKLHNFIFGLWKRINWLYVLVFRGTPMIVQAMIFYYGIGQIFNINLSPIVAAMIIISINTGAYISEIFRAGIESIDQGQYDATEALGFTHRQAMQYVILPQAIRNVLPAIGNEFIINIKDSAVLFAIGVTELYTVSKQIAGTNFRYYEVFIITCAIYFVLTTVFTKLLSYLEKRLDGDEHFEMIEVEKRDMHE